MPCKLKILASLLDGREPWCHQAETGIQSISGSSENQNFFACRDGAWRGTNPAAVGLREVTTWSWNLKPGRIRDTFRKISLKRVDWRSGPGTEKVTRISQAWCSTREEKPGHRIISWWPLILKQKGNKIRMRNGMYYPIGIKWYVRHIRCS